MAPSARVQAKAHRLVVGGCVRAAAPTRWGTPAYDVRGTSGRVYNVQWHGRRQLWLCPCSAMAYRCSHVLAVEEYRRQEKEREMAEQTAQDAQQGSGVPDGPREALPPASAAPGGALARCTTVAMTPQVARPEPVGDELDALWDISQRLAKCGLFRTRRKIYAGGEEKWITEYAPAEDVFFLTLAGRDLGLSAAASARHLALVGNAVVTSAEIMRSRLHQFGYEYDFTISEKVVQFPLSNKEGRVVKQASSPESATMKLWRRADPTKVWEATYTIHEAVQAGLCKPYGGYEKNPADMLVSRAGTRCVRRWAPEVLNKTYLADEMGLEEESDGDEGFRFAHPRVEQVEQTEPTPVASVPSAAPPHDPDTGEVLDGEYTVEPDDQPEDAPLPDPSADTPPPEDDRPITDDPPWHWPELHERRCREVMTELGYETADIKREIAAVKDDIMERALLGRLRRERQAQAEKQAAADFSFDDEGDGAGGSRLDNPDDVKPEPERDPDAGSDEPAPGVQPAAVTAEQAEHWVETWATASAAVDGETVPEDLITPISRKDSWRKYMMEHGVNFGEQEELCRRFELPAPSELDRAQRLAMIWYVDRYGKQ